MWQTYLGNPGGSPFVFYPLDIISNWNRIYGRQGFLQYQFVLPKKNSYEGMKSVLEEISASGMGSFLSVLKLMGPENDTFLSFPWRDIRLRWISRGAAGPASISWTGWIAW
ncbi:MAG: hypothetical protein U5K31_02960 [Balneolaceae bacterium]|nr:hypothetical protein [Balneolaceae bacterium]